MFQSMPETLREYAALNVSKMKEQTKLDYLKRWNSKLAKRDESNLYKKIDGLVNNFDEEFHSGQLNLNSAKKLKAAICYGLSTLLDQDAVLLQQYSDGEINIDILNATYVFIISIEISKKYLQAHIDKLDLNNNLLDEENFIGSVDRFLEVNAKFKKTESDIEALYKEYDIDRSEYDVEHVAQSEPQAAFPKEIYRWIKKQDSSGHPLLELLQLFLQANLLLGLRPIEWTSVRFGSNVKSHDFVAVIEKSINKDLNDSARILILTSITQVEKDALINFKQAFDDYLVQDGKKKPEIDIHQLAENRLRSLQKLLKRTLEAKSKQPVPTLLSTRSQVIANAKKSNKNIGEITAFFGFTSDNTARKNVAQAGLGWGVFKFKIYNEAAENKKLELDKFIDGWG